jgi:transcriptional regulator with XRE-family HTH domain
VFGRRERARPLSREQLSHLEDLRDDCIALFINSGLTQKDIHARGGPTPATISKWLYKETMFPRYQTLESFALALGYGLSLSPLEQITAERGQSYADRLGLDVSFAGRPKMPRKKPRGDDHPRRPHHRHGGTLRPDIQDRGQRPQHPRGHAATARGTWSGTRSRTSPGDHVTRSAGRRCRGRWCSRRTSGSSVRAPLGGRALQTGLLLRDSGIGVCSAHAPGLPTGSLSRSRTTSRSRRSTMIIEPAAPRT